MYIYIYIYAFAFHGFDIMSSSPTCKEGLLIHNSDSGHRPTGFSTALAATYIIRKQGIICEGYGPPRADDDCLQGLTIR